MMDNMNETPKLTGIPIYVDGELDKQHELTRYMRLVARIAGHVAWKSFEVGVLAIDGLYEASRASRHVE